MPYRANAYTWLIFLIYQNVMILGDFNADGSYVSKKDMKEIRIRSDKNFHWLISDDVDTTVNKGNDNTYDRWVTQILLDVYYYSNTNITPISCHPSLRYPYYSLFPPAVCHGDVAMQSVFGHFMIICKFPQVLIIRPLGQIIGVLKFCWSWSPSQSKLKYYIGLQLFLHLDAFGFLII